MGLGTGCQLLPKIDVVAWHPRPATRPYLQPVTVQIGFLRAVNVGRRRVAMGRLVEVVEGLGYGAVWTYINSGNVVFEASGPRADLEQAMGVALESAFGFEVTTFVRTEAELRRAIAAEPFEVGPGATHFLTLLKSRATPAQRKLLEALTNDVDTLVVNGRDVHWRMHGKSSDTTLPARAWDAIVGPKLSTSRNTTMLRRLVSKLDR